MTIYLTTIIYTVALLTGIVSFYMFLKAYHHSGRQCFHDYQRFLISFTLVLITTTLSIYIHSLKDLSLFVHRIVLSGQILSYAFLVYSLPQLLLSAYYHSAAKKLYYFFTNLSLVTLLMIPPLWFWPSSSLFSFPFIITLVALAIVFYFLLYLLYQNRDEINNSTPMYIKFILIGFFMACCIIILSELTITKLTVPGLSISFSLIYILWNGLSLLLLNLYKEDSLATTSGVQALKQNAQLSDEEALIVEKIIQGKFNQEIANDLNLPIDLLNDKIAQIFSKAKIKNRIALLEKIHQLR